MRDARPAAGLCYEFRIDADAAFHALVGDLDYPMLVVTTAAGGERAGCLVGFATQTSIAPHRFLVCLSQRNRTYRLACSADLLAVHLVPAEAQDVAELFGGRTGDDTDKFARCRWRPGPGGVPLLDDCPNRFVGRILDRLPLGDHDGFLLEPIAAEKVADTDELTFQRVRDIEPGHEA